MRAASPDKERYESAVRLLPARLRSIAQSLDGGLKGRAEEFRLRAGRPFSIAFPQGEVAPMPSDEVTPEDISELLRIVSKGSIHTVAESLKWGFVTAEGGHRVGVCGSAIVKNGEIAGLRNMSSASLRIAKELKGIGNGIYKMLVSGKKIPNILIVSPPGGGKTTLLRDFIRLISDGGMRVAVADERNELAALNEGIPGFDIGMHTDVIEGCGKPDAVMMLLRAMNPQVIAMDEITTPEDMEAMERAANCGVSLLATAHAYGMEDLKRRVYYRAAEKLFDKAVLIEQSEGKRRYTVRDFAYESPRGDVNAC